LLALALLAVTACQSSGENGGDDEPDAAAPVVSPDAAPQPDLDYTLELVELGQDLVELPGGAMQDLSGLAYAGDARYFVVDDGECKLRTFSVSINLDTGLIADVSLDSELTLEDREDCEEVAVHPDGTIYVSDEIDPSVVQHLPSDGRQVVSLAVPAFIQSEQRSNFGFEALAIEADGARFWAANEGSYEADGPLSTQQTGMPLRLQQWDADGNPSGQWGYIAERIPAGTIAFHQLGGIGIVDMEVTDDGRVLVLERTITSLFANDYELYIFEVERDAATEISGIAGLSDATWKPVVKRLLFHRSVSSNFESMTLGPELANGDRSLLVMSEGLGSAPALWSFRLRRVPE